MEREDRRISAMRRNPRTVTFATLQAALESHGFIIRHGKGDHFIFSHHLLSRNLSVPAQRPYVKPIYVRAALAALELAAVAEETEEDARNNEGES